MFERIPSSIADGWGLFCSRLSPVREEERGFMGRGTGMGSYALLIRVSGGGHVG